MINVQFPSQLGGERNISYDPYHRIDHTEFLLIPQYNFRDTLFFSVIRDTLQLSMRSVHNQHEGRR